MKTILILLSLIAGLQVQASTKQLFQGSFFTITPGDDVSGDMEIIQTEDGNRLLVLKENFSSAKGPFLYVVLHTEVVPTSYSANNAVVLSMLKSFDGKQVYRIPQGLNLEYFKAVIIWCEEFDVTFGSAALLR